MIRSLGLVQQDLGWAVIGTYDRVQLPIIIDVADREASRCPPLVEYVPGNGYGIRKAERLAIVYTSEIDGEQMRIVEFLRFRSDGLICEGEAMRGIVL